MEEINVFAKTTYRGQARKFGIKTDDRRRHMYVVGKTGVGKSTLLENMIINDIRAGHGVAVVDPHGDLAEKMIEFIPTERINDVIYFNPADIEFPIAFNVIETVEPHLRHLVASGLIGVFQKLWADSWGPRLEYILRNAILAILDYPGSTLLAVVRMLSDKPFRKKVIEKITDPVVKAFWVNEFASYADKFASEAVSPIQNKVGQFLSSSLMRNIVGQVKSSINIREVMDNRKILILNLSKGRIGEDNSSLLGAIMITKIQLAAMSRVDMPEKDRNDFYLYIDEFQNFMTDSFANILSEARKYHLNLTMAHQYIEQLSEKVAPAVFGNVGTMVVYRVGAADAEALVKEFTPTFTEEDMVNLPKYQFYTKLMIDGVNSTPFSAECLPPLQEAEKTNNTEKVIRNSRERYAQDREMVEEKIMRWSFSDDGSDDETGAVVKPSSPNMPNSPASASVAGGAVYGARPVSTAPEKRDYEKKEFKKPEYKTEVKAGFEVNCSRCNKSTQTKFKPDGVRPVYCSECLAIVKAEKLNEVDSRKNKKQEELNKLGQSERQVVAAVPIVQDTTRSVSLKVAPSVSNASSESTHTAISSVKQVIATPELKTVLQQVPPSSQHLTPRPTPMTTTRPSEVRVEKTEVKIDAPIVTKDAALKEGGTIKTSGGGTITIKFDKPKEDVDNAVKPENIK